MFRRDPHPLYVHCRPCCRWTRLPAAALAFSLALILAACGAPVRGAEGLFERLELPAVGPPPRLTLLDCHQPPRVALEREGRWQGLSLARGQVREDPVAPCPPPLRPADPEALADGELRQGHGEVAQAWLAEPTGRYDHGVLGDAIEAGTLRVRLRNGDVLEYRLGADAVFEDLRVRGVDLDGDAREALLVVQSGLRTGAALAVFAVREGRLERIAASEPLGRPHRWMNPAGVADFTGDGRRLVAAVRTPHIGGLLTLYERQNDRLVPVLDSPDFSNHAIGTRELRLSALLDADGNGIMDIALPSGDRRRLRIVTFASGRFRELQRVEYGVPIPGPVLAADLDGDGRAELVHGLADGRVVVLWRR